jgi:hypothetical protein
MEQYVFKTFSRVKCILCWAISPLNKDSFLNFSFSKRNFFITKQYNFYRLQRTQSVSKKLCFESNDSQELTWPSCCSWAYLQHIIYYYYTEMRNPCDSPSRWHSSRIKREWYCNSLKLSSNLWLCQDRKSFWVFVCVWAGGDRNC